jgi:hypothetical protein
MATLSARRHPHLVVRIIRLLPARQGRCRHSNQPPQHRSAHPSRKSKRALLRIVWAAPPKTPGCGCQVRVFAASLIKAQRYLGDDCELLSDDNGATMVTLAPFFHIAS